MVDQPDVEKRHWPVNFSNREYSAGWCLFKPLHFFREACPMSGANAVGKACPMSGANAVGKACPMSGANAVGTQRQASDIERYFSSLFFFISNIFILSITDPE